MDSMNPIPGEPTVPPIEPAPSERITGYCRTCGKPLTESTTRVALGTVFCEDHAPNVNAPPPVEPPSPYQAAPRAPSVTNATPGLAFLLGLLPGVGARPSGRIPLGVEPPFVNGGALETAAWETPGSARTRYLESLEAIGGRLERAPLVG